MPSKATYWRNPEKYREKARAYMAGRKEQNAEANRRWRKKKSKDRAYLLKDAERCRRYRQRKRMMAVV